MNDIKISHHQTGIKLFLLVFSLWFLILRQQVFSDTPGADSTYQAGKLTEIRSQLEEKRKSMELLHQKEKNAYEELLDLEERLDLSQRFLRQLGVREKEVEKELESKEESRGKTDTQSTVHREQFQLRLREMYKHRGSGSLAAVFDAASPTDLLRRLNLARIMARRDKESFTRLLNIKEELEKQEADLRESRAELAQLEERKTRQRNIYSGELKEKERLLKRIRSEQTGYAQAVDELEKNAAWLEKVVAGIQPEDSVDSIVGVKNKDELRSDPGDGFFIISKGKLPWPIRGRVISRFGEQANPQFKMGSTNTGVEIESAPGEEVAAVSEGRVVYSSGLRGYGNLVILEHDDGYYTLYARLSEIRVSLNQKVERLQTIGTVGENGLSFKPTLHFEVRKGKQPQNPLEWLRP
jgi:septal ring factor EnvC (AmiA/AmiB activator)